MTEPAVGPRIDMEILVSLSKRRGFVFQSSEIYGGLGGFWDYGPLGVELRNNVKRAWWKAAVQERDDIVGLDASILMNPRVWVASGHVDTFADPMVDCRECKKRFRADDLEGHVAASAHGLAAEGGVARCPECGGELTEPRMFNLMFKTFVGPVEEQASTVTCGRRRLRACSSTSTTCSRPPVASSPSASPR